MKTKKCSQCKNLISVTAPTCLYCGRPNKFVTNNYVKIKWDKKNYKTNKLNIFKLLINKKIIFIFIVILILLFIILKT